MLKTHVITNSQTGEIREISFTSEEQAKVDQEIETFEPKKSRIEILEDRLAELEIFVKGGK